MRGIVKIIIFTAIIFFACKKDAGIGGKNHIDGTVFYKNGASGNNDPASFSKVSISYGSQGSTSEFDQVILTDDNGKFNFKDLRKGTYFIKAEYSDANGFVYNTPGFVVELNHKKSTVELNITLE